MSITRYKTFVLWPGRWGYSTLIESVILLHDHVFLSSLKGESEDEDVCWCSDCSDTMEPFLSLPPMRWSSSARGKHSIPQNQTKSEKALISCTHNGHCPWDPKGQIVCLAEFFKLFERKYFHTFQKLGLLEFKLRQFLGFSAKF